MTGKPLSSLGLQSRRVLLRQFQQADMETVYNWHCNLDYLYLWAQDRDVLPYDRFVRRFERDLKKQFDLFFMVEQRMSGKSLGFVYSYAADSVDRNCYICIFIDPDLNSHGAGIDASIIFLNYLFNHFGYRKVLSEVYAFNNPAVAITEKAGFVREGCLKEHRWWNGRFWDQYIYAITPDIFNRNVKRFEPFLFRGKK